MKITVLTSSKKHPVYGHLTRWGEALAGAHDVEIVLSSKEAAGGDFLFMISCSEIVGAAVRERYRHSLVVHASALPKGRGWSPYVWQILAGADEIPVTLLEAEDKVDTGRIWLQKPMILEGHELSGEIHEALSRVTVELMSEAVEREGEITPRPQSEGEATTYPKRTREDSRLELNKPLGEQINLLRVCDPERYPAFFEYKGHKYTVKVEKADD